MIQRHRIEFPSLALALSLFLTLFISPNVCPLNPFLYPAFPLLMLTAQQPITCQYEWAFPTSAACGGAPGPTPPGPTPPGPTPPTPTPPAPAPLGPGGQQQDIASRNFGCGHISCGWMFLILVPLVGLLAFGIAIPLNKFVIKKDR